MDNKTESAAQDHVDYPAYPTRSIAQLRDLLAEMRDILPQVLVPALLIHSREDTGVVPENMDKIYQQLGTPNKQKLWIENSGHVITREPERQTVFQAAAAFMERINQHND